MTTAHIDRSDLCIPKPKTFVYDSKHDIKLDAYIPQPGSASGEAIQEHGQKLQLEGKAEKELKKMPVVVQFHLGGMVGGSRVMVFPANLPGELSTRFLSFSLAHSKDEKDMKLTKAYSHSTVQLKRHPLRLRRLPPAFPQYTF